MEAGQPEKLAELMKQVEAARAELGAPLAKQEGSGTREPGRLTDEEAAALQKLHWPEGKK